jgi:hypothetical protein
MAKGVRLRLLSLRGSWVQIPPPASLYAFADLEYTLFYAFSENGNGIKEKKKRKDFVWLLLSSSK